LRVIRIDTGVSGAYPPARAATGSPNALLKLEAGQPQRDEPDR
jgi:hypothetical protein